MLFLFIYNKTLFCNSVKIMQCCMQNMGETKIMYLVFIYVFIYYNIFYYNNWILVCENYAKLLEYRHCICVEWPTS